MHTAAFINSLLTSQDLKEKILDQPDEAWPTNIPAVLLAQLSDKQGEEATMDNLTGVSQAGTKLKDLRYHTALSSALGPSREGRPLIPERVARPADVLIPKWSGMRDTTLDVIIINSLKGCHKYCPCPECGIQQKISRLA